MRRSPFALTLAAAMVAVLVTSASSDLCGQGPEPKLGTIAFPTSGAAAARPHFIRGVLYLHSFEYDSAAKAFREAQRVDPGFAMAYWGEAMTFTHPVWNQQNVAGARTALGRLAATPALRRAKAPTERERGYFDAIEILYGEGSKARRDTLFAHAMERLAADFPDDHEARTFHALAIIGLSQGVRDVAAYMRAAAIADDVFRANPDHPGAAHYIIHAFDDPTHAPLGLRAARAYSGIAPAAGHAQHMTSHIYIAMGMWDDVVQANEVAWGQSAHTSGHYGTWLAYAYLQQGRYREAAAVRQRLQEVAVARSGGLLGAVAVARAAHVTDGEQWSAPAAKASFDTARAPLFARAMVAYADAYAALKRGDLASGRAGADAVARYARATPPSGGPPDPRIDVAARELSALVAHRDGRTDDAITLLREAAESEEARPYEFGPPEPTKPPRELLGELLLEHKRPAEARREFERSLARAPGRARSLLGLARASTALGDSATAARAYAELRRAWRNADQDLPEIAEVRKN